MPDFENEARQYFKYADLVYTLARPLQSLKTAFKKNMLVPINIDNKRGKIKMFDMWDGVALGASVQSEQNKKKLQNIEQEINNINKQIKELREDINEIINYLNKE